MTTVAFQKSTVREYFESIVVAVILALFIRTFVVQAFKIPTGSMEPNLLVGDHLLVNKFVFAPTASPVERALLPMRPVRRGDVVVFKYPEDPERDFIKRIVGLPGETIEVKGTQVLVNGAAIPQPFAHFLLPHDPAAPVNEGDPRERYGPVTVPDGHYFAMGDNRDNSQDSRYWGFLPAHYIKGRALMIYWSFETGEGGAVGGDRIARRYTLVASVAPDPLTAAAARRPPFLLHFDRSFPGGVRMSTFLKLALAALVLNACVQFGRSAWTFYQFEDSVQQAALFSQTQTAPQVRARIVQLAGQYAGADRSRRDRSDLLRDPGAHHRRLHRQGQGRAGLLHLRLDARPRPGRAAHAVLTPEQRLAARASASWITQSTSRAPSALKRRGGGVGVGGDLVEHGGDPRRGVAPEGRRRPGRRGWS